MSDIFREVDEALQREKFEKFWKSYGPTLVLAAIVLVVSTGITTAYRAWVSHDHQVETTKLVRAFEDKDSAAQLEKAAGEAKGALKTIAFINAAHRYADKKDFKKAAALYDSAASNSSGTQDLRDLANLFYVRAAILADEKKQPDYKKLIARIEPVAKRQDASFRLQARIETAMLYGDGLKDYKNALSLLTGFEEDTVSASLKEKADAMKHVYAFAQSAQKQ